MREEGAGEPLWRGSSGSGFFGMLLAPWCIGWFYAILVRKGTRYLGCTAVATIALLVFF